MSRLFAALLLGLLTLLHGLPPATAQATEFPAGYEAYHTYSEMVAALDAAVAGHPHIVRKLSIGQSHEGRELWAVKVSDNVGADEDEPEILFDGGMHGREHLTVEMNLYVLELLTTGYGTDSRITAIVDSREIFLVPMLNPDGQAYDIGDEGFRDWRKNRQPIPGTSAIGIDPNRNFGFKWGCCRGSSGRPRSIEYRGWAPWVAPEVRAYRNFVDSRVVGGRQQITGAISWHAYGEMVMWPYGYTRADAPLTMTVDDQRALREIGEAMARHSGYIAQQMSDLYVLDGASSDWLYFQHRIFALTVELYPPEHTDLGNFHPPDTIIAAETARNREAVLYFLEQADCFHRTAGLGDTHCGPLNDDFEIGRGWRVNPTASDTATRGRWQRADAARTRNRSGVKQIGRSTSGRMHLVTGRAGGLPARADIDGGLTSVVSPEISLGEGSWALSFRYSFSHDARATARDYLRLSVIGAGGEKTPVFNQGGAARLRNAAWKMASVDLSPFAGERVRILIEAADGGRGNLVEAAIDDVRIFRTR